MANGGIIGPVNDPTAFNVSSTTQFFTSSGTFTSQPGQNKIDYLVVAGGGSGAIAAGSCQITTGGGGAAPPASSIGGAGGVYIAYLKC